jgi:quinol monooxygenase YgiN
MFAICVTFTIKPGKMSEFLPLVRKQAQNSLTLEATCRQFDICTGGDDENELFLYELYDDRAAIDAHLATRHFAEFNAATADFVAGKEIKIFSNVAQPGAQAS